MKKKILTILSLALVSQFAVTPVFATEKPLEDSQNQTLEELQDKAKADDNSNEVKKGQEFDISKDSYSFFYEAKGAYQGLQNQYGSLDKETNAGEGFKSYLKSINEDKDNQQLLAQINQIAQGKYSKDSTQNSFNSLKKAINGVSDEDKQKQMIESEKQESYKKDNEIISDDYNSDVAFGEGFVKESETLKEKYNNDEIKDKEVAEDALKDAEQEFGEVKKNNSKTEEENKNKFNEELKKNKEQLSKDKLNNDEFAKKGNNDSKTVVKNYGIIRKGIIDTQKAINNQKKEGSKVSSKAKNKGSGNSEYSKLKREAEVAFKKNTAPLNNEVTKKFNDLKIKEEKARQPGKDMISSIDKFFNPRVDKTVH